MKWAGQMTNALKANDAVPNHYSLDRQPYIVAMPHISFWHLHLKRPPQETQKGHNFRAMVYTPSASFSNTQPKTASPDSEYIRPTVDHFGDCIRWEVAEIINIPYSILE